MSAPPTFDAFLPRRGYDPAGTPDALLRRLFVESWREPGFHRFWQVWNPMYGWVLYRLYLALGGAGSRRSSCSWAAGSCCTTSRWASRWDNCRS